MDDMHSLGTVNAHMCALVQMEIKWDINETHKNGHFMYIYMCMYLY